MPYLNNYLNILQGQNNNIISVFNWDRFQIEKFSKYCYKDKKIGHKRNFLEYAKYASFIRSHLKSEKFDKVIIFGLQLIFFLGKFLCRNYKNEYILDIRDFHPIKYLTSIKQYVDNSKITVLSSPGFMNWLPKSEKYIINHNISINSTSNLNPTRSIEKNNINISCIGALKDYDINIKLINALANIKSITLKFRGEGIINNTLNKYITINKINNVIVNGRYEKEEEATLYSESDMINMLMTPKSINNNTCLSNRLYNAAIYGRPLIALKGSLISKIIAEYKLGLIVTTTDNLKNELVNFISLYDPDEMNKSRIKFLNQVMNENLIFNKKIDEIFK